MCFCFLLSFYEEGIRRFELAKRAQDICFLAKFTTKFELISDHKSTGTLWTSFFIASKKI